MIATICSWVNTIRFYKNEKENLGLETFEKPRIFVDSITFNDNTVQSFEHGSIMVFTGANNSGKIESRM